MTADERRNSARLGCRSVNGIVEVVSADVNEELVGMSKTDRLMDG